MARHKTEAINLRMSPEMKATLRLLADREHRTLSNMIEHLLIDYCERNAIARPAQDCAGAGPQARKS
ncbi:hypothetical protein U5817_17355 [Aromatoleum evansii]|uniref:CopG-like ribbon-helix-helix domain-containing protein n=1 Tax=Aromatoleum evansii TaxID=59406 RepID=A0ABZ1AGG3_AROEV|nr:hypothetical protein U5817_17355 [Aromatoleum evansii]